jgi:FO synthase
MTVTTDPPEDSYQIRPGALRMPNVEAFLPSADKVSSRLAALEARPLAALMDEAVALRRSGHGDVISFSPKVFVPVTRLCRDACGYCTFAKSPRAVASPYLSASEILELARRGAEMRCTEALFTLGDRPEQRYRVAAAALREFGHDTTVDYLSEVATLVHRETGLLVHVNAGIMDTNEIARTRQVSASQGIMLETSAARLGRKGGPHFGCASKVPAVRIDMIARAGVQAVPFTTGILIGIGETRAERIEALLTIKALHERYGHIQEVIVQNFLAKPRTVMAGAKAPAFEELLWTVAAARHILGPRMHIQAPPNLSFARFGELLAAGIDDWGGVSPLTPDHVNPEAPWPEIVALRAATERFGCHLVERLPVYPDYVRGHARWLDPAVAPYVLQAADAEGWARVDRWSPGIANSAMRKFPACIPSSLGEVGRIVNRALGGDRLDVGAIQRLFAARDGETGEVVHAADTLRRKVSGETVRYVVNRNINYTNICEYKCAFCAFSKGKTADNLRGKPYNLSLDEVARRAVEAWERGATEVCMQGGIHPSFDASTYLALLRAVKDAVPVMHVHAFSPLEVLHGAQSVGETPARYLERLREAGLGSLPGTAAEILDDDVRAVLCPDKLSTAQWLAVVEAAHRVGLRTTATIMFGHMERPADWARHLLHVRDLQERTGGFTEFVPLPFVHSEAPVYYRGQARRGPTSRETILMHAVSRLVLHPLVTNIQTSWVKLGLEGIGNCLEAGANDLGGTLMNESISRAAGAEHGQEMPPDEMDRVIVALGRQPQQRTTLYRSVAAERQEASYQAAPLLPMSFDGPPARETARAEG